MISAPKLTSEFALIKWETMCSTQIQNLERALSGIMVPTCFWRDTPVKLFEIQDCPLNNIANKFVVPGYVEHQKSFKRLKIMCANNTSITVKQVGVFGKKIMTTTEFYNGFLSKVSVDDRYFTWTFFIYLM